MIFFMSVALIRLRKSHPLDEEYIEYEENAETDYLFKWLDTHYTLPTNENVRNRGFSVVLSNDGNGFKSRISLQRTR